MTHKFTVALTVLLVCGSIEAVAQPHIACPELPNPKRQNQKCSGAIRGDPVNMMTGSTLDFVNDFELQVGDDRFTFGRTFVTGNTVNHFGMPSGFGWNAELPAPFGGFPPTTFHSLQAAIWLPFGSNDRTLVLLPEMYWNDFTTSCIGGATPCFLSPIESQRGTLLRLQRLGAVNSRRYILIREDGEHWRFEPDPASSYVSRLTIVEDRLGRTRFNLTYATPPPCAGLSDAGVPPQQLDRVNFRNGSHLEFLYNVVSAKCVLSSVRFHSGTPESFQTMVTYTSNSNFMVTSAARSTRPNETYAENTAIAGEVTWTASTGGTLRVSQTRLVSTGATRSSTGSELGSNFTSSYAASGNEWLMPALSTTPLPANACVTNLDFLYPTSATSFESKPSPSTLVTRTLGYFSYVERTAGSGFQPPRYPGQDGLALAARCDRSPDGGCQPGTETLFLDIGSASGACMTSDSISNLSIRPGGRYENVTRWRADGGVVPTAALGDAVPLYSARGGASFQGALTSSATPLNGALETTFYNGGKYFNGSTFGSATAVYDTVGTEPSYGRRFDTVQQPSTLVNTDLADRYTEGDLRLGAGSTMGEVVTGNTVRSGATTMATRKTRSFISRVCDAPGNDPYARVLRREGPCWWNNSTSACETSEPFPTTEYYYFAATDPGFKAGRLHYVKRYPNRTISACGSPLTTEFVDYDAEGHPTTVIDETGVTTNYTYSAGRLTSRTVVGALSDGGSATTTYTYEASGELRHIQYPEGNYLVFCRHDSSWSGFCNYSQQLLPKLQWIAKSASSDGSGATEKQTFEYGFGNFITPSEGPLRLTKYFDAAGNLRKQVNSFTDTEERVTHTTLGSTAGGPAVTRNFDIVDNLAALGGSFSGAPELCNQSPGVLSPLCVWFTSDRADRLAQVDSNPTGAVSTTDSIRTCIDYDQQGNVRRVARGCPSNGACAVNSTDGGVSSCVNSVLDYDVDDFGDTVSVKGAWRADTTTSPSLTRYEYNARGLVTKKTTQSMANAGTYLKYTYDAADRPLTVSKEGTGGSVLLYAFGYDSGNPGTGCPSLSNRMGRLAYRSDSFGVTWYSYDAEGRVTMELRQRAGSQGSCAWGGSPLINNPHTTYTYTPNGNLKTIQYPYGRSVTYTYNATDRVQSISAGVWDTSTSTPTMYTIVGAITWEPFGGVRSYAMQTGANFTNFPSTVEYYRGPLQSGDTPTTSTNGISCAVPTSTTATDASGRVRALLVSNKTSIFKQVYTWNADQLVRQQTCVPRLGQTTETSQEFTYDKTLRLTGSSGSTEFPRITAPVNPTMPTGERIYSYDRRGNRTSFSVDKCARNMNYLTGLQEDLLISTAPVIADLDCSNPISGWTFLSDADGRAYHKSTFNAWWVATFDYAPNSTSSGLDSVVKAVTIARPGVASVGYSYRYDAFNRRRLKTYPFDAEEEFFYDVGQQLLSQRSGNVVGMATQYTVDDFIWLDGKPIVMVRGSFSTTFARNLDTQASCNRFGESGACGVFHLVHDILPKPVLMLQASTGKISNVVLYDDFGNANRIPVLARRGSPWASTTVATVTLPVGGATQQYQSRAFHNVVDLPAGMSVTVNGSVPVSGNTRAAWWSDWTSATTSNQVAIALSTTACGTECSRNGTQSEAVEFKRYEVGAAPMWTTMRFPGQQYDLETDLHENWNRFYEPMLGRYLSPEPLLQRPAFFARQNELGNSAPTYGYARNNPVRYVDRDGRFVEDFGVADASVGIGALVGAIGSYWCATHVQECDDFFQDAYRKAVGAGGAFCAAASERIKNIGNSEQECRERADRVRERCLSGGHSESQCLAVSEFVYWSCIAFPGKWK